MSILCQLYKSSFMAPLAHWRAPSAKGGRYPPLVRTENPEVLAPFENARRSIFLKTIYVFKNIVCIYYQYFRRPV